MLKDAWNPQNKFCGKKRVCETLYPVILNVIKLAGAIRKQIGGDLIARRSHAECRFGLTQMQEGRLQVIQGAHRAASCDNVWPTAGKTGGTGRVQRCLSENQRQRRKKNLMEPRSAGSRRCRASVSLRNGNEGNHIPSSPRWCGRTSTTWPSKTLLVSLSRPKTTQKWNKRERYIHGEHSWFFAMSSKLIKNIFFV